MISSTEQSERPSSAFPPPDVPSIPRDNRHLVGGVWLIVLATLLLLCGACSALAYILIPLTSNDAASALSGNVIFGASAGVGVLLGGILLWQGLSTAMDSRSITAARVFPPSGVFILGFAGALLFGVAALMVPPIAAYAFPPWHFAAALLTPLALMGFAARRLGQTSGLRALVVSFTWGALGSTALAILLELMLAVIAVVSLAIVIAMLPNGPALLRDLQNLLAQVQRSRDPAPLMDLFSSPWVTAALLFYFAVIVPPLEEAVKALVVAFVDPLRTRRADALLWGIAAGAGFAVMENIFNSAVELSAWAFLVVLRVGAAIIHVTNGANMGLGWYAARVQGKWGSLVVAYLVSVVYHAAWNATAIFLSTQGPPSTSGIPMETTLISILLLGVLVVLAIVGLVWTIRTIRRERPVAPAVP